jgi:pilus assembly protein CpaE
MKVLRVIVFNMDESFAPSLRTSLQQFGGVRIVAEVDEPAMLPHVVSQFQADVLVVHLDPNPEVVLPIAGDLVPANPGLAIFGVSESTDGQLILGVMRRGFREFITKPIEQGALDAALEKVAQSTAGDDTSGKLIAFMGTAGGVGTTSLATNLAVELKELCGGSVAVVDLDYRFGQVATFLDVAPTYTIADLAHSLQEIDQHIVERALIEHQTGVKVLSRPVHFTQCDNITAANCVSVLNTLVHMNDYVIVDGPNRYDVGAASILDLAELTLLVTQLMVPSVRNAQRIFQGMEEAGFSLDRSRLIINRIGKASGTLSVADVEATLNTKVFATIPDDWETVSAAVNYGETLCQRAPKSRVRQAIVDLAQQIHSPGAEPDEKSTNKKGNLLSKIFSDA